MLFVVEKLKKFVAVRHCKFRNHASPFLSRDKEERAESLYFTSSTSAAAWIVASANAHDSTAGERACAGEVEADAEIEAMSDVDAGISTALGAMLPRKKTVEALPLASAGVKCLCMLCDS